MTTIDRDEVRQHAEWVIANCTEGIGAARDVLKLLAALEQAEADCDYWQARAYEAEKRSYRAEARIKAVEDVLNEFQGDYLVPAPLIHRALDE